MFGRSSTRMSTLATDAVVATAAAAAAEDEYFDDDVDRAAEWPRRKPTSPPEEEEEQARGELYEAMDADDISLKLAVSCCVAVSVLMYGVFRRLVVIYDAFVPGRLAAAAVLLLAAVLIWREQQELKRAEEVHASTDR